MNSAIIFPPAAPALKLARSTNPPMQSEEKWAATLAEERRRLLEDQEVLRVRENNLREYEMRLRALQAEIEAGSAVANNNNNQAARGSITPFARPSSKTPFESDAALQLAWEKLHRARELLEAEQAHLRDDRIILHDQQAEMQRREEAVTARETRVAEREKLVAEAAAATIEAAPVAGEHTMSAMARLTRTPFDMARSVFGGKK